MFRSDYFVAALPAFAQDEAPARGRGNQAKTPAGPVPKLPDGHPNLQGVWRPQPNFSFDISKALAPGETIQPLPWAAKLASERMSKDDPEANCQPTGVPRVAPYPWKIIQQPNLIVFLFEANMRSYRQIFMNRKDASERSRSDVARRLDRTLGRRHAGGGYDRLQRSILV